MNKIDLYDLGSSYQSLYQYVQRYDCPQNKDRSYYYIRRTLPELFILQGKLRQVEESDKKEFDESRIQEFDQLNAKVEKLANRVREVCSGYSNRNLDRLSIEIRDVDSPELRGPLQENEHEKHLSWVSNKIDLLQKEVEELAPSSLESLMQNFDHITDQINELTNFLYVELRESNEGRITKDTTKDKILSLGFNLEELECKLILNKMHFMLNEYKKELKDYQENRMISPSYRSMTYRGILTTKVMELQEEYRKMAETFPSHSDMLYNAMELLKISQDQHDKFQNIAPIYDRLDLFESAIQSREKRMRELILERYHSSPCKLLVTNKMKKEMIELNSLQDQIVDYLPLCRENEIKNEELVRLYQGIAELLNNYNHNLEEMGIQFVLPTRYHSIEYTVTRCMYLDPEEISEEQEKEISKLAETVKTQIDFFTLLYPNGSKLLDNWKIIQEKIALISDQKNASELRKQIRHFEEFKRKERPESDSKNYVDFLYKYHEMLTDLFFQLNRKIEKYRYRFDDIKYKISELTFNLERDRKAFIACMTDCLKISIHYTKEETTEAHDVMGLKDPMKLKKIEEMLLRYEREIEKTTAENLKIRFNELMNNCIRLMKNSIVKYWDYLIKSSSTDLESAEKYLKQLTDFSDSLSTFVKVFLPESDPEVLNMKKIEEELGLLISKEQEKVEALKLETETK